MSKILKLLAVSLLLVGCKGMYGKEETYGDKKEMMHEEKSHEAMHHEKHDDKHHAKPHADAATAKHVTDHVSEVTKDAAANASQASRK